MNLAWYRRPNVVLPLLMGVATLLFALVFAGQSLRLDEAQSLWQTSHSPRGILTVVAQDVHVPLYHLMLHVWQLFLGNGVVMARLFSLIPFLLTIPAIYVLGREMYDRDIGLFAALLVTISPFLNWYGSEIRMYSLLAFVVVLNQIYFVRIYRGREAWTPYALTALAGIYTHYFFTTALLAQAAFFFMRRREFPAGSLKRFMLVAAGLAVALAPWLLMVHAQGARTTQPLLAAPTSVNLFNSYSQFLFGFQDDRVNTLLVSLWPIIVLLGFLVLRKRTRITQETKYLLIAAFLPVVAAFAVSLIIQPIFVTRYLIVAVPALYLFIAWLFATYPPSLARWLRVAFVGLMVLTLFIQGVSAATPAKENYRQATDYLESHAQADDVIAVSAPFTIYPVEYYYRGPAHLATLPPWDRTVSGAAEPYDKNRLPADIKQVAGSHDRIWLLQSYDQGYEEEMRIYFDTHYEKFDSQEFSDGMHLYGYRLRYDVVPLDKLVR